MNTTQSSSDMQPMYQITDADRARQEAIQLAWQAHDGELAKPLTPMPNEPDMNVMGNEVMPAVNAIVDFVFGDEVEISVGQEDPSDAQKFLDDVWGRKETRIPLLQRLLMNGDASGRAFMRIVPGKPSNKQKFRLIEVDPATIFVETSPQDCQTVVLFCIQYSCDSKNAMGKPCKVYYREEILRIDPDEDAEEGLPDDDSTWLIQHWTQEIQSGNMQPTNDNWIPAGDPIPWPYPFPPIFSCQNLPKPNDFWGYPGISKSLIGINNSINFVNSNINVTEKIQRILYAPGMGDGSLNITPGKIVQLPLPENEIKAVNMQSNTANSRDFVGDLRGEVEELTSVPMIASGRTQYMPNGPQSGIAIKMLFMSLLKKMNKMRCLYGELIIDVSKALLVLGGFSPDIDITLGWQNPLPIDEYQELQAAQLKNAIGVSKTTLLKELGYDPIEEAKLRAQEAIEAVKNNPIMQQTPLQGDDQQDQNTQEQDVQQDTNQQANGQPPVGRKG